jgi:hypothetical protein
METMYFTLGIASVLVTALAVATIWAVVKVVKLNNTVEDLSGDIYRNFDITSHNFAIQNSMILVTTISNLDHTINHRIDKVIDVQDTIHQENRRYVDSRIDKMLNDPKFCLNNKNTKQLING